MTHTKRLKLAATMLVMTLCMTSIPAYALQYSDSIEMPAVVNLQTTATGCTNSPGPIVTLEGIVALGDVQAEIIFRNNLKGTHTYIEETRASVNLNTADIITVPKQPSQGGTGGNPFIWIQFTDGSGNPITGEIFLGRCVQGLDDVHAPIMLPASVTAELSAECSNTTDVITLEGGQITLKGLTAKVIFRNNDNPVGGPHEYTTVSHADTVLIPMGEQIVFQKQPVLGGVGGNPHISIRFVDKDGSPVSEERYLGRCVQDF
jgi:hypothetical protein